MWFWEIIKEVIYNLFVEIWYVGLTALTLLVFFGIMLFEALKEEGRIFIGILVLLIFAAVVIYIVYWYFANHHYILGAASILICFAVIFIAYIEPNI